MKTVNEFTYSSNSSISGAIKDNLTKDDILSVSLSIKASHAGKVNGNNVFYTPRSMRKGAETLTFPFKKHLQNLHQGDAVGEINEATFIDYTERYDEGLKNISKRIDTAQTPKELVSAVKELINHSAYQQDSYKGLGVIQVSAELYDEPLIEALATGTNKGQVSIGGNSRQVYCSVCSELFTKKHKHVKGKTYGGEECFAIYDDMVLDHIGFVPDPADDKTETVIVSGISDSLSDVEEDATVSIEYIKIQDNKQGKVEKMTLDDLKQQLKADASYLVGLVTDTTEAQQAVLLETLKASQKHLRSSGYLLTEEKLLPINTKENVALAVLALEQLEDSPQKTALLEMLKVHTEKHFEKDDTALALLQAFVVESETEDKVAEVVAEATTEQPKEGEVAQVAESAIGEEITTGVVPTSAISEEALAALVAQVVTGVVTALKPTAEEEARIQDSMQLDTILSRNKQLEVDIDALDAKNLELTNKYKDSIISQILLHKGIDSDDEYAKVLQSREIDVLDLLLEDVKHDLKRVAKAPTTDVESTQTAKEAETAVAKEIEKAPISDSIENSSIVEEETTQIQDNVSKETNQTSVDMIRQVGVAQFLKNRKANSK